ncbi:MAG: 2-C-methyl-D-erythritol 4-phosphate cytidylyltransferase [Nitrospiraceae bacterium]|nr:2-C-methyl-D-erythritol 4-phosphate cytidylyltransferase [Nitrospiraceae bacterium]
MSGKKIIAIVPAAGLGQRFGAGINKTFNEFNGQPLILTTLMVFENIHEISEVIPVFKKEDVEDGLRIIKGSALTKVKRAALGGKERQDSVFNGLTLIEGNTDIVLIHDGARPLADESIIKNLMKEFSDCDGAVLGVPLKDTIKEAEGCFVKKTLNREILWAVQTPQIFNFSVLMNAYKKAMKKKLYFTDDAAIVENYGGKIKIIMGSYKNIKITTPEDIKIAKLFLKKGCKGEAI